MRIYRQLNEVERREHFEAKIEKGPNCWRWNGATFKQGYGAFAINGKKLKAHRLSYEYFNGPIPDGLSILHKCDNKICVNPAHLEAGTQAKNISDAYERGRMNHPKGESVKTCKLNEEAVREIRAATWKRGYRGELAAKFGVSDYTISDIRARRTWRHV